MKKLLLISFFCMLFFGAYTQTPIPLPWNTTGNSGTSTNSFLGTTDCKPLIFKTGNQERMRLLKTHSRLGIGFSQPQMIKLLKLL